MARLRHLILVLGDQLDPDSAAFDGFSPSEDAVWMAEVVRESTKVWSHRARITLFLSGLRHFREQLLSLGWTVKYRTLDEPGNSGSLGGELSAALSRLRPEKVVMVEPGEWSVGEELRRATEAAGLPLEIRSDRHFLCSRPEFERHAAGRRQLRLEFFYREMRRRTGFLMEPDGTPAGGAWNFDAENRESFGRGGPGAVPAPRRFPPDAITREVLSLVGRRFPGHPGALDSFDWPVTTVEARAALDDFIRHRLAGFGRWQDAMWTGEPWLWHSRLSAALNLKLINPREVLAAAEEAWRAGGAPLAAVEGFGRQILGWREYVRGIYWEFMPEYLERNALGADRPLPSFYWTGETEMRCLRESLGQTLRLGYAHHIQRLMVTGLFALLLGVRPRAVHEWYLAVYVDAVEWVELPNTLGMSQYGDGGLMASKPYAASGKYIQRMSNYCAGCRFDPAESIGPRACPFTTFYWDFLLRHRERLSGNPRMAMSLRNLGRLGETRTAAIRERARALRSELGA